MYSIEDLRTFVAIAEAQGVTAGAMRVAVSPATASHRLSKLERALKLTLFHRNSRTMKLTDEGQVFFDRTRSILADLAQAERDAGSRSAQLTGHLRVTMSPWILSRFVLPALPGLQREHPKVTFEFLAVDRFVSLSAEGMDCAIRVGQLTDSALVAKKLSDNDRIICAAPSFLTRHSTPKNTSEIVDLPWACLPWQTRIAFSDAKKRRRDATVRASVLVSNSDTLTDAVVGGIGLAVKSRLAIKDELADGRLVEVAPGSLWRPDAPIWFVYPPEARSAKKTELFGDFVTSLFQ
ncbi:LysR family transcriptional regulator [Shimia sp. MMG029]|uniref:LysR family transcriptional regulator n=1 Tax=Shimia sp. MMG029 TaxID=3021978 RepID=UPI0022FE99DC|nr:LysR family transcriptional regulator [Shimia sp. MMG029]MDA5558713.1 LysR family transcriptional regulator [Shimia sp. MMG029]